VCVDVGSNSTAAYVTGLVRGATKSLVLDLALLLEGRAPYELPEVLLGACRCARARLCPWRCLLCACLHARSVHFHLQPTPQTLGKKHAPLNIYRMPNLDLSMAKLLDTSGGELPIRAVPPRPEDGGSGGGKAAA
jgi:hypothetical protein